MAVVDWLILGVVAVSALISIKRGFVREALSLLTWIAALIIARIFGADFSVVLEPYITTPSLRLGAAYVILFVVTLMLGGLVNYLVGEFVEMVGLSGLDSILGMFFGLARGVLIVGVVVAGMHYALPVEDDEWYRTSKLIPEIVVIIEEMGPLLWEQGEEFINGPEAPAPAPADMPAEEQPT